MGKKDGGFLAPKAIANRMKAKGLGKLKWWCQLCNKQCRDENGYKCHLLSESHNRQVILYTENPGMYANSYSREFESTFMNILRVQYGTKRVAANQVYQQQIADKQHVHMNATTWGTLSGFVQYLGRTGKAHIEETEKGWFITYIERDPEAVARQEAALRQDRMAKTEEERQRIELEKQVERAFEKAGPVEDAAPEDKELKKAEGDKIVLALAPDANAASAAVKKPEPIKNALAVEFGDDTEAAPNTTKAMPLTNIRFGADDSASSSSSAKRPRISAMEEIRLQEELKKQRLAVAEAQTRVDYWMSAGLVVKVINKKLADGKYYKQKGVVESMQDQYVGTIRMLEGGDVLRLDQEHCETVIPAIGGRVRVVNGSHRGEEATLVKVDIERFQATLKLMRGDRVLPAVPYEDFCKINE